MARPARAALLLHLLSLSVLATVSSQAAESITSLQAMTQNASAQTLNPHLKERWFKLYCRYSPHGRCDARAGARVGQMCICSHLRGKVVKESRMPPRRPIGRPL
jgi:hypothetical protein